MGGCSVRYCYDVLCTVQWACHSMLPSSLITPKNSVILYLQVSLLNSPFYPVIKLDHYSTAWDLNLKPWWYDENSSKTTKLGSTILMKHHNKPPTKNGVCRTVSQEFRYESPSDAFSTAMFSKLFSVLRRNFSFVKRVKRGFAVRVRSAGQKYGPTCHQRDRADVTEFVTLVRLSSLGQHVGHAASSGLVASPNPIAAIPFVRASGKGLL